LPHAAPEALAALRLVLADVATRSGQLDVAKGSLEALIEAGPSGQGYAPALERLEALLEHRDDGLALSRVREQRAELVSGGERYALLYSAARAAHGAGALTHAIRLLRDAVAAKPSLEALRFLAEVYAEDGQQDRAARALSQAAAVAPPEERAALWVRSAETWERAGNAQEAIDLLDRVRAEFPGHLSEDEVAGWFTRLGDPSKAFQAGFQRALAAGDWARATALAQAADHGAQVRQVLWIAAERDGGEAVSRLAQLLTEESDAQGLLQLAERAQANADSPAALALCGAVIRGEANASLETRAEALRRALSWGAGAQAFEPALEGLTDADPRWVDQVLGALPVMDRALRLTLLGRIGEAVPSRMQALAEERLEIASELSAWPEAVEALADLEASSEGEARAGYLIARGQLTLDRLGEAAQARQAFLDALALTPDSEAAREGLIAASEQEGGAAALAEDLEALLGRVSPDAALPVREALARSYAALDRAEDLYRVLGALPESQENLERRAKLAGRLGRVVDALELRERLTDDPAALEDILSEYLVAELLPNALRLAEKLRDADALSDHGKRLAAERLSSTKEGAGLAARLWPELLTQTPLDADGWTLFSEALARTGRQEAAAQVDGVGAALVGTLSPSVAAAARPLRSHGVSERGVPPPGLIEVGPETMPRLFEVVRQSLEGFGVSLKTWLDPHGGVEAYLLGPDELVIGAGALGAFGPSEVRYLIALGLALGPDGVALRVPGQIARLAEAAAEAFDATPSTLAAAKVIARVDPGARGADPAGIDPAQLLRQSDAFLAVTQRVLGVWGRGE
jgi:tetratricopeptide (TPR) repeat protein